MENSWILFTLLASLSIGLYGFAQKIKAEMPHQSDNGFIFYSYLFMMLSGLAGAVIFGKTLDITNTQTILFALGITLFYIVIVKTRLISLRYLSSSTYFINYRIASSTWLVFVGIFLFSESISLKQIAGLLLGFFVFYLLIEKKNSSENMGDIKKGFLYLLVGSLAVTGVQGLAKNFALGDGDIFTLVFFQGIFGTLSILILKGKESLQNVLEIQNMKQAIFLGFSGIIFGFSTIMNNYALVEGNLAIVYKIISYSLFIPIILSIIFYKESVTSRKLIAFGLTILSIFLFI